MENMEVDIKKKYLPIGTVVLLKGGTRKVMVMGFRARVTDENNNGMKDTVWDYSGCIYPEGLLSSDQILVFDHSQISKIYHIGFHNEEDTKFKNSLNQMLQEEKNNKKNNN